MWKWPCLKTEGGRIAARFLPQSDVIGLMLKDNKFMEQQNKKGRPLRNDRPFGILVPRRGLGHTGATPVGLACPTFLALTSGAQAPDFLGWKAKSRPSCDDRLFWNLVPRRGLEPPHPKAHGPEPCASTNYATWAFDQGSCPSQAFNYRVSFLGKASIFHSINLISISS